MDVKGICDLATDDQVTDALLTDVLAMDAVVMDTFTTCALATEPMRLMFMRRITK